MIDQELHVEDVIEIYNEKILVLKKEIDRLNEEVQVLNIELLKARAKKMFNTKDKGSHDLEVIIYKLRNYADYLEEKIKDLEQEIKDLKKEKK
jgi:predicted  nucleic acid-binding Zn-ribbon protein